MPQFKLFATVSVSAFTTVEADSAQAALDIALGREVVLGGNGSGNDSSDNWIIEDGDGEPFDIRVEG
jgi:hypothetical protein